jgi:hypothetical protein
MNINNWLKSALVGVLSVLGAAGNVFAQDNCVSNSTQYVGSIGSQTTCADHSMSGCIVGSGETSCTASYSGPNGDCSFTVNVTPAVGDSTDGGTHFSVEPGGCQLKLGLFQGNTGSNYCYGYYVNGQAADAMYTYNKGKIVPHKQAEFCTNGLFAGEPNIKLDVTLARAYYDEDISDYDFNCGEGESVDELHVIAPSRIGICHTITNSGDGSIENISIVNDNGTPDDTSDDFTLLDNGTSLPGGGSLVVKSDVKLVQIPGPRIYKATVAGYYQSAMCDGCSDDDTATLNVAVACDETTQNQANLVGTVVESNNVYGTTVCGPAVDNTSGDQIRSVALLCGGVADIRESCKEDPASCPQPWVPSKNWTYIDEDTEQCIFAEPTPGNLPLCEEVITNPANEFDCTKIINPNRIRRVGNKEVFARNPTIICVGCDQGGGGSSTGTVYCLLDPGESPSVCPKGSYVF